MYDATLAGDLIASGAALSGLILVFLGGVLNAYDAYDATQRSAVQAAYRSKAWFCFAAFCLALVGTLIAFFAKWSAVVGLTTVAAVAEGVSLLALFKVALDEVRRI